MKKGLEIQIPLLARLRDDNTIRIQTLSETGRWYKDNYSTTAPSAISALTDYKNTGKKTVWYNSKYYRANLFWEGNTFRFRDIHLFDERFASDYIDKPGTTSTCLYTTLPFVDGNIWSSDKKLAGLRLFCARQDGTMIEATGREPEIAHKEKRLYVRWPLEIPGATFVMTFDEDKVRMQIESAGNTRMEWYMELSVVPGTALPFTRIDDKRIDAREKTFDYKITCKKGTFADCKDSSGRIFRIKPENKEISISFKN